jgi:hypothetical protein
VHRPSHPFHTTLSHVAKMQNRHPMHCLIES